MFTVGIRLYSTRVKSTTLTHVQTPYASCKTSHYVISKRAARWPKTAEVLPQQPQTSTLRCPLDIYGCPVQLRLVHSSAGGRSSIVPFQQSPREALVALVPGQAFLSAQSCAAAWRNSRKFGQSASRVPLSCVATAQPFAIMASRSLLLTLSEKVEILEWNWYG